MRVLGEELKPDHAGQYSFCWIFDGAAVVSLSNDTTSVNPYCSCNIRFGGWGGATFLGSGRTQEEAIKAAEEKLAKLCRAIVQLGFSEPGKP